MVAPRPDRRSIRLSLVDACNAPGFTSVLTDGSPVPVRLTELELELLTSQFQFYGRPVRQIWLAKDGYLSFGPDNPDPGGVLTRAARSRHHPHGAAATAAVGDGVLGHPDPARQRRVLLAAGRPAEPAAPDDLGALHRNALTFGQRSLFRLDR